MKVLLDTHVFIWLQNDPDRLGAHRRLLEEPENDRLVSVVVAWEIAIKHARGLLELPEPPSVFFPSRMNAIKARPVAIEQSHALAVGSLPPIHRDLFDRMLIAQAKQLGVPIMTADPTIAAYPVETISV